MPGSLQAAGLQAAHALPCMPFPPQYLVEGTLREGMNNGPPPLGLKPPCGESLLSDLAAHGFWV